jgi:hypothetical protein
MQYIVVATGFVGSAVTCSMLLTTVERTKFWLFTNAVVAILLLLSVAVGVNAVDVPVKVALPSNVLVVIVLFVMFALSNDIICGYGVNSLLS